MSLDRDRSLLDGDLRRSDLGTRCARPPPRPLGCGLLLIGIVAVVRAWMLALPPPSPWDAGAGEAIPLVVEGLRGEEFRLLPGVGPALAARLEAARVQAGGQLHEDDLAHVRGVGPALRHRWSALRTR